MKISLTYGVLPSREDFDAAFERACMITHGGQRRFRFANDPRVGTCALTAGALWRELGEARNVWERDAECTCPERQSGKGYFHADSCPGYAASSAAGRWCSDVLSILGFEWV